MRDDAPQDAPLLLLCAEDGEVELVQLVDALNRAGRSPEVVAGVEGDSSMLSAATDRVRTAALFVLCASEGLDGATVRRLSGLFSARRGPGHRLLVVDLDPDEPLSALPAIEAALDEVAPVASPAEAESRVPRREVVRMPSASVATSGSSDREPASDVGAEALARAFHDEMLAAEAVLRCRRSSRGPRGAEPTGQADGVPQAVMDDPPTRRLQLEGVAPDRGEGPTQHRPSAQQAVDADDEPTAALPGGTPDPVAPDDSIGPLSSRLGGVRVAEPLGPPGPAVDEIPSELTPTDTRPRRRDPEESDTSSPAQRPEHAEPRRGWVLATLGALALGGLAWVMTDDDGEPVIDAGSMSAVPVASRGPQSRRRVSSEPRPTEVPEPAAPEPAAPEPATPEPAEPEPATPEPEPATPEPAPPASRRAASSTVPPPPSDSEGLRIGEALRGGKLHATDSLLVADADAGAVDWKRAKASCRREHVAGLHGWHLASRRELTRLRGARVLTDGIFWSREVGEHADEAYALDAASGDAHVYLQVERAARALCVRKR